MDNKENAAVRAERSLFTAVASIVIGVIGGVMIASIIQIEIDAAMTAGELGQIVATLALPFLFYRFVERKRQSMQSHGEYFRDELKAIANTLDDTYTLLAGVLESSPPYEDALTDDEIAAQIQRGEDLAKQYLGLHMRAVTSLGALERHAKEYGLTLLEETIKNASHVMNENNKVLSRRIHEQMPFTEEQVVNLVFQIHSIQLINRVEIHRAVAAAHDLQQQHYKGYSRMRISLHDDMTERERQ